MKRILPEEASHMLEGFNNLTKSLRTNLYFVNHKQDEFWRDLSMHYNAAALQSMLQEIANRIEAVVLACSRQDYQPWGASALMLLSDAGPAAVHMHLNKSHLCAHTFRIRDQRMNRPSTGGSGSGQLRHHLASAFLEFYTRSLAADSGRGRLCRARLHP